MEIALNSDKPGGFTHENAIASHNGLALLASLTLKNALNINNNNKNNNSTSKNNNINKHKHKNNNNNLNLNHNNGNSNINSNKHNIKHHKSPQPQHGYISSSTNEMSSSVATISFSSANLEENQQIKDHKKIFSFTSAGLQAIDSSASTTTVSSISNNETVVNDSQQQLSSSSVTDNNQTISSISTNNDQSNIATSSAKEPAIALLDALAVNAKKKQQQNVLVPQQQQHISTAKTAATATYSTAVGNGGNSNSNNNRNNFKIPSDILDDLASRFIINVPDMELNNLIRLCFQIELAHWFYLDFFCSSDDERKLQSCGFKQFALQLFEHIPFLRQHLSSIDKILEDWKNYKLSVPTYGAILISEDLNYCLLVQSYFAKSSWGFPKGKINENEDPVHCATREVYEETGYDITELIVPNDYIEAVMNYQYTRLYIVRDVSLETKFSPRTRNEIKCCDWFPIDSLPVSKNDAISKPKLGINANSFFMIMPFVKRLKKWVNDKRNGVDTRRKYSGGAGSPTSTSPPTNGQIKSNSKKQHKRNNSNNYISNDDINALNNNGVAVCNTAFDTVLTVTSCGNNANSNSMRSKRQRHKSMGDLDGIKLNNLNNYKTTNNSNNNYGSITTSTITVNNGGNNINSNNNNNQKRHSKNLAAGSNFSNNNNTINNCINNINGNNSSSKRQLFHSQSQTNNIQQSGEKIVSSFDLIRKEKQQMKAALAKTQKQQQNGSCNNTNNCRQRAKSQSEKISMQQQQQKTNVIGNHNNNKQQQQQQQRLQKQQSLIVTNSNMQSYNMNSNSSNHQNNINSNNSNSNKICNNNNNQTINNKGILNVNTFLNNMTIGGFKTPTPPPPPVNGNDLLALAAAVANGTSTSKKLVSTTNTSQFNNNFYNNNNNNNNGQQKPRPSSVSLHFPEVVSIKTETSDKQALNNNNQMPQLQRMASGTNLRILKRSTSHQPTQQNHSNPQQPPQRQASALQFTPSFNSWTNFTFTKNFIANVFC